ncbi:MAG: hypothetical protein IPI60_07580 [Saprospiraceae bacterium]|nr:hypothetical protein [Saprospiraceae bacterium]
MIVREGENVVISKSGQNEILNLNEILESWNPLSSEPISDRIEFFKNLPHDTAIVELPLSEMSLNIIEFWRIFIPDLVPSFSRTYSLGSENTQNWEIQAGPGGLFFKDIDGHYGFSPKTYEQIFSDFFFFGPPVPIPDIEIRIELLKFIQMAFTKPLSPVSSMHFPLCEYPKLITPQLWESGDWKSGSFVRMGDDGVTFGETNWRDGLSYFSFISFEQILQRADIPDWAISPEILIEIRGYLMAEVPNLKIRPEVRAQMEKVKVESAKKEVQVDTNSPGYRQDIALKMWKEDKDEESVNIFLSLLEETDSYWTNIVFSQFGRMFESQKVKKFIRECLEGTDEKLYKKAFGVLQLWHMHGDMPWLNREIFMALDWSYKLEDGPIYRYNLERVTFELV